MSDQQAVTDAIDNVMGREFALVALKTYIDERGMQWTSYADEAKDLIADLQDLIIVSEHADEHAAR